jgi:hypothetical protein
MHLPTSVKPFEQLLLGFIKTRARRAQREQHKESIHESSRMDTNKAGVGGIRFERKAGRPKTVIDYNRIFGVFLLGLE